jgi:hypothetical protein
MPLRPVLLLPCNGNLVSDPRCFPLRISRHDSGQCDLSTIACLSSYNRCNRSRTAGTLYYHITYGELPSGDLYCELLMTSGPYVLLSSRGCYRQLQNDMRKDEPPLNQRNKPLRFVFELSDVFSCAESSLYVNYAFCLGCSAYINQSTKGFFQHVQFEHLIRRACIT